MTRPALERELNPASHRYAYDALSGCHICRDCGTAEHRNGQFWWCGRWSMTEPPCEGNHIARVAWFESANLDPDEA